MFHSHPACVDGESQGRIYLLLSRPALRGARIPVPLSPMPRLNLQTAERQRQTPARLAYVNETLLVLHDKRPCTAALRCRDGKSISTATPSDQTTEIEGTEPQTSLHFLFPHLSLSKPNPSMCATVPHVESSTLPSPCAEPQFFNLIPILHHMASSTPPPPSQTDPAPNVDVD